MLNIKRIFIITLLFIAFIGCNGNGMQTKDNNNKDENQTSKPSQVIEITSVTLEGKECKENGSVATEKKDADLVITFKEKYEELSVTVNGQKADINENKATYKIENLTQEDMLITIVAKLKNKTNKTFNFKAHLKSIVKLGDFIFIEEKINNYISSKKITDFEADANNPNNFKMKDQLKASDWAKDVLFLVQLTNIDIKPKYAIFNEEKEMESIPSTEWKDTEKKTIKYQQSKETKNKEGYVVKAELPYEKSYLYFLFDDDGIKTYYQIKIFRTKEPVDSIEEDVIGTSIFNADDNGNILPDRSPISTKGILKIRPRNPRAKVKLLIPTQMDLNLNADGTYFEYTIPLTEKITEYRYQIISEDDTKRSNKNGAFFKDPSITSVKFAHAADTPSRYLKLASIKDAEYYIPVLKKEVKENTMYLHLEVFKGLSISSNELPEVKKTEDLTYTSVHSYDIDVTSINKGNDAIKTYNGDLILDGKNAGKIKIHFFKATENIKEVKVATFSAYELPNNEYIITKIMAINGENIHVIVHKGNGETKANTNQSVKILFKGSETELEAVEDDDVNKAIKFTLKDLKLAKDENAELIIKYYKDKTDTSTPPKEYKLIINNRRA